MPAQDTAQFFCRIEGEHVAVHAPTGFDVIFAQL
jgi:hypothetical protein